MKFCVVDEAHYLLRESNCNILYIPARAKICKFRPISLDQKSPEFSLPKSEDPVIPDCSLSDLPNHVKKLIFTHNQQFSKVYNKSGKVPITADLHQFASKNFVIESKDTMLSPLVSSKHWSEIRNDMKKADIVLMKYLDNSQKKCMIDIALDIYPHSKKLVCMEKVGFKKQDTKKMVIENLQKEETIPLHCLVILSISGVKDIFW